MLRGDKPQAPQSPASNCSGGTPALSTCSSQTGTPGPPASLPDLPAAAGTHQDTPGTARSAQCLQTPCSQSGQEPWVSARADAAWTQILQGEGRADGASLAQMSRASGLHSGPAPQISATERPQKASLFIGGLRELYITMASHPQHSTPPRGADNPTKGLMPESPCFLQC